MTRFALISMVLLAVVGLWTGAAPADEPPGAVSVAIQVSPSTINLAYEGTVVTVHADIPYAGVVTSSLYMNGVQVWWTKSDSQGNLVAKFDVGSVKSIVAPPSAQLELVGTVETREGDVFDFGGTDSVKVIDQSGKR
jgi:hypothetical protein